MSNVINTPVQIKQGDTTPALRATLQTASGTAQSLAGATVRFTLRRRAGRVLVVNRSLATIVDAANGIVEYQWQPADTAVAGAYEAEFEVTFADGRIATWPNDGVIEINITPQLA